MNSSGIFIEAARRVADKEEDFSCIALFRTYMFGDVKKSWKEAQGLEDSYAKLYKPERTRQHRPWWSGRNGKCRDERVLALLFMATIYESEGD